jgi:hypothetical protein
MLTAAAVPSTPDPGPTLFDEIRRGIIPSLGAPLPTPPPNTPIPVTSSANQTIKNIYNAVEPWVRYGFEVATYAVGWIPYVGWLSGQIMIFYNFGERIVRSITFNVADWLFGPLPFLQGLRNVARDSWNALVQLGIDEWNYFLPPLPPLPPFPFAAKQTASATVPQVTQPATEATSAATGRSFRRAVPPASAAAPLTVNLPAVLAHSPLSRHPGAEAAPAKASSQRQATHDNAPQQGVGQPKPR